MSKKRDDLLAKLYSNPKPRNFTTRELDQLMSKCNCEKYQGGRGSGLKYFHMPSGRILAFDGPHPENELYIDHVNKVRRFLLEVGEYKSK